MDLEKYQRLAEDIAQSKQNIRNKYILLKRHLAENDEYFQRALNPITKYLKPLVETFPKEETSMDLSFLDDKSIATPKLTSTPLKVDSVPKKETSKDFSILNKFIDEPKLTSTPLMEKEDALATSLSKKRIADVLVFSSLSKKVCNRSQFLPIPTTPTGLTNTLSIEDSKSNVEEGISQKSLTMSDISIEANKSGNLASAYICKLMKNDISKLDTIYGVRFENNELLLGNKKIQIINDVITVGDEARFFGTPGLYGLLFLKNPDKRSLKDADWNSYRQMLKLTQAHKKDYNPKQKMNRLVTYKKYRCIAKLFPPRVKR